MSAEEKKPTRAEATKKRREELRAALPEKITVFGMVFDIVITRLKDDHGLCDIDKRVIKIHDAQDVLTARATLFHEAIHAAFAISGQVETLSTEHEEGIVRMIEHAFAHIVDVNKLKA